jgi:secreted trypsin-like serine protease
MSNEECERMYKTARQKIVFIDTFLCAGYAIEGKDSREGDSGGPLAVRNGPGSKWLLTAIISYGVKCGKPILPGIYARISKYRNWIIETNNKQMSIP